VKKGHQLSLFLRSEQLPVRSELAPTFLKGDHFVTSEPRWGSLLCSTVTQVRAGKQKWFNHIKMNWQALKTSKIEEKL